MLQQKCGWVGQGTGVTKCLRIHHRLRRWTRIRAGVAAVKKGVGELAKAVRVSPFGQLGRVVKSANLLGLLLETAIMANTANVANAFTTGRG